MIVQAKKSHLQNKLNKSKHEIDTEKKLQNLRGPRLMNSIKQEKIFISLTSQDQQVILAMKEVQLT